MTGTNIPPIDLTTLLDRLDPQPDSTCNVEGCVHHSAPMATPGAAS